jgi:hypothetical protein
MQTNHPEANGSKTLRCGVVCLAILFVWAEPGWAAEESQRSITKETILEWVERYGDAQPQFKPGDTVTAANREQLRPFLPPGYFEEFAFPEAEFAITPTGDYAPPQAFRDATEKFASQTRLATDGALEGYIAGQPFPNDHLDPQDSTAGIKAAWNFNFRWQHYGQKVEKFGWVLLRQGGAPSARHGLPADLITGGGTVERVLAQRYQRVYLSHLAMLPQHNYTFPVSDAAQLEWKDIAEFTDPYEMRGQRVLMQRAADPHVADQAWSYVPSLRKVRRVSVEEKSDSALGSDTTFDDYYGFSGRVLEHNWKFYGWKQVLHVMNSQHAYPHYYGPKGRVPHDRWELRRCAVIEQIPKDPRYPYSSKILFWDAQTYQTAVALAFDREGKLWKVWGMQDSWSEEVQAEAEMNHGTSVARYLGVSVIDVKNEQATLSPTFGMGYPKVTPEDIANLYDLNKLTEGKR